MSIKMNELAQETRVKFQEAIADGRITAEEWQNFSQEEQELLSKGLGGKTPTVGDDIILKASKKAQQAKKQERAELSWGEIGKQGLKSVGNFFKGMVCDEEGFSLTRTATTVGTVAAFAALAVVSAPVALAAGAALGAYMVYDGGKKAIDGTREYYEATTHEEAAAAMEKAMDGGVEIAGGVAALFGVKKGYSKIKTSKAKPTEVTQSSSNNTVAQSASNNTVTQSSSNNTVTSDISKWTKGNGTKVTFERGCGHSLETRVKTDGSKCTLEKNGLYEKYTELDVNGNVKLQYEFKILEKGGSITTETVIKNGKQITTVVETEGYGPNLGKVKNYKRYLDGELKTNRNYEYTSDGIIETRNYLGGSKKKIKLDNEPLVERTIEDRYWQGDDNNCITPNYFGRYTQERFEALW